VVYQLLHLKLRGVNPDEEMDITYTSNPKIFLMPIHVFRELMLHHF